MTIDDVDLALIWVEDMLLEAEDSVEKRVLEIIRQALLELLETK